MRYLNGSFLLGIFREKWEFKTIGVGYSFKIYTKIYVKGLERYDHQRILSRSGQQADHSHQGSKFLTKSNDIPV
jgi:hypothetical protein